MEPTEGTREYRPKIEQLLKTEYDLNEGDLLYTMVERLIARQIDYENALFVGHSNLGQENRTTTFALAYDQYDNALETNGPTPLRYARTVDHDPFSDDPYAEQTSGPLYISVYDATKLEFIPGLQNDYEYRAPSGTVNDALHVIFDVSSWRGV